jgi:hypothetical protein
MPTKRHAVQTIVRSADLATDFGLEWATKLFGAEAIASLPVRSVGKNKGAPKGHVLWEKAATAGYVPHLGHAVAVGSLMGAWIGGSNQTPRGAAVSGKWLGRVQTLAASSYYLFEQGRERHAAEVAANEARIAEQRAEWLAEEAEIDAEIARRLAAKAEAA